ncbi:calcium/sodium antiporter [Nocardiopsis sp. HNM0947]|uniref:Calcium/sodium antiporter n=1 Tax=Nocardiopsis coralli TaxID=2772213 RepID=A0ABR9PA54_9ACTN|nr:calcium/sodium antiporter [Nocardiopsis coralli]
MAVLVVGGELLVRGATGVSALLRISPMVIGLTVVAIGSSLPELAVGIEAALRGYPGLVTGNIVGTNIVNLLLILGISAALSPILTQRQMMRLDLPVVAVVAVLLFLLSLGGSLSWPMGVLLLGIGVAYTVAIVRNARRPHAVEPSSQSSGGGTSGTRGTGGTAGASGNGDNAEAGHTAGAGDAGGPGETDDTGGPDDAHEAADTADTDVPEQPARGGPGRLALDALFLLAGIALVILGADWLVSGAVDIATALGVSDVLIGLTVVAIGTSAPELVTSIVATIRGQASIAIGNLIGSSIYNIVFILGLTVVVAPVPVAVSAEVLYIDMIVMAVVSLLVVVLFRTGRRVTRLEGLLLVSLYLAYLAYLIIART